MGRWDGAGGASHSGCVGSVGGMGKGEVVVVVVAHRQVGNSPLNRFGSVAILAQESCTQRKCFAVG